MAHRTTREFSICLLTNTSVRTSVEAIRSLLPASPYRDDPPHITLLRTIKTPRIMSDEELAADLQHILGLAEHLPQTASVKQIGNKFTPLYKTSCGLLLQASDAMAGYRKEVIQKLLAEKYRISFHEQKVFIPHITIRLGVRLTPEALLQAQEMFANKQIILQSWSIFRVYYEDGKRLMKEVIL